MNSTKENDMTICDWIKERQKFTLSEFEEHIKNCDKCKSICCAIGKLCSEDNDIDFVTCIDDDYIGRNCGDTDMYYLNIDECDDNIRKRWSDIDECPGDIDKYYEDIKE